MNSINKKKGFLEFFYDGRQVRIVQKGRETWWVLKDVCDVLGISNPTSVANRLDKDEKSKQNIGRQGEANIVNESGLYNVIMRSDKPNAKPFMRWITHEVFPHIYGHETHADSHKLE
jgi:prophage antirepressor-like protein